MIDYKDFLKNFASDRSHMFKFFKNGKPIYISKCPSYPTIKNKQEETDTFSAKFLDF